MAAYLRPRGDRARAVASAANLEGIDGTVSGACPEEINGLAHGDLVYKADGYRGTQTWVVDSSAGGPDGGSAAGSSGTTNIRLVLTCDDSGYCEIPAVVSAGIEDPLDFYSAVTAEHLYQGVSSIVFDAAAHQGFLRERTGGRPVHASRHIDCRVDDQIIMIKGPVSPDCPEGGWTPLDTETPDEYLGDLEHLDSDPVVARAREQNRILFTEEAPKIFAQMAVGTDVNVCNYPSRESGASSTSGEFLYYEPGLVVLQRPGNNEVFPFRLRRVELEHGPYAGIDVWASCGGKDPFTWMISDFGLRSAGEATD